VSLIVVDRIALTVPGGDEELGRRLAQAVALRLVSPLALRAGEGALERLALELRPVQSESVESLAARIATGVATSLADRPREAGR
jgi:hypothetical protein